jgi:hypothetical protein
LSFSGERRRGAAGGRNKKDDQMGEYEKNQGQTDQAGQQTDKSAFGQFDKDETRQDKSERGQQDREDLASTGVGGETSSAREQQAGQQGDFGGKGGGQQEGQDQNRAQQGDNRNEMDQGNDQTR